MTAAEFSAQISDTVAAVASSPTMKQLRERIEQAERTSRRLQASAQMQRAQEIMARHAAYLRQVEEARRLEEATRALDRSKRSRLRQVFDTWDQQARTPASNAKSQWLASQLDLESYLQSAHHHPAIAREKPGGVRAWFEDWRELALVALGEGLDPGQVSAIVAATPVLKEAFELPSPCPGAARGIDWLRERFIAVVYPNPPSRARFHQSPVLGGELATTSA